MRSFLVFLMFLLIYSPKIGGRIDTLSIFSLLVFVISLLNKSFGRFYLEYKKLIKIVLSFAITMLIYSFFLVVFNDLSDLYQVLRFGRVFVNSLGLFGLGALYYKKYGVNFHEYFLFHLWLAIIMHALVILLMFLIPSLNVFVIDSLLQANKLKKTYGMMISGNRIGGLTTSWDATSGVQSLGLLMLFFVDKFVKGNKLLNLIKIISIPLSLFAMGMSGVTGFVTSSVALMFVILINFNSLKSIFIKLILLGSFLYITLLVGLTHLLQNNEELFRDSSLGRTAYMITQNDDFYAQAKYSADASSTVDGIFNKMYFLPENFNDLVFGRGGSGRSDDYILKADPGPTLNLHNLGLFFVVLFYSYYLIVLKKSVQLSQRNFYFGTTVFVILLVLLVIDAKVQYLLARQSFSIMLIALICLQSNVKSNKLAQ